MDPLNQLSECIEEARQRGASEPDAMALATATADGVPSVRIVLCRGVDTRGVRFFTNYDSRKGVELSANPNAAVSFFWPLLGRQIRVEGRVERLPARESDEYFAQRPRGHRVGAWASAQSRPLESLELLRARARDLAAEFQGKDVPRPDYWGGFLVRPRAIEFWTSGVDRLHDRVRYDLNGGVWLATRLSP